MREEEEEEKVEGWVVHLQGLVPSRRRLGRMSCEDEDDAKRGGCILFSLRKTKRVR